MESPFLFHPSPLKNEQIQSIKPVTESKVGESAVKVKSRSIPARKSYYIEEREMWKFSSVQKVEFRYLTFSLTLLRSTRMV